ncbi:NCS1 family nucleobase:cation symporter-1 [Arthrobacter sp. PvP102]|uniref:NCS1 family nucleobase:cation symporter-1 n=1 Tax=unclassified Arthrobacter TaxID=235627 RepID=UPI001AEA6833|nr:MULTISPECIES: NCS1 family nucleobase:cation symporter-1 [unclassified Arthrobacter]MBP1235241.1 NCS1 family nucleobase:cation symporter-1 [Arthrobacter sp. PvP103]MBP1236200.1 NCS1 family nucleobase:cation symporter-1 [Arthrobacter sp. PvP102]
MSLEQNRERDASFPAQHFSPRLSNEDLLPVKTKTWGTYSLFAMWMSNVHSVAGYVFAASLFALGIPGWQVLIALLLGIGITNFFVNKVGKIGQTYGIPFAVSCRPSFGVLGANIPGIIKAIIATCWYGIQTWVASTAIVVAVLRFFPDLEPLTKDSFLGLSTLGWAAFLILWAIQFVVFYRGIETVRRFCDWAGPGVYVVMFLLAGWIVMKAGPGNISFTLSSEQLGGGQMWAMFFTAVALVVSYFAGTTLNFADFSRLLKSPKSMTRGNFLGLPVNLMIFALVTVITTSGGYQVFGEMIMDPVHLVARIDHTTAVLLGVLTFAISTVATNIVANFISAAFDLANLIPSKINFRRGGIIASILAIVVMPWNLYSNPTMIQYTLGTLGALIGPLFGILMADYYRVRKQFIETEALYTDNPRGAYWYTKGFNLTAVRALAIAAALSVSAALVPAFSVVAPFSWFVGAGTAFLVYPYLAKHPKYGLAAQSAVEDEPAAVVS